MSSMIKEIKTNIELTFYGYDPNEFMPVMVEGKCANKSSFVAYKAKRTLGHLGFTHDNMRAVGNYLDQVFVQQTFRPTL